MTTNAESCAAGRALRASGDCITRQWLVLYRREGQKRVHARVVDALPMRRADQVWQQVERQSRTPLECGAVLACDDALLERLAAGALLPAEAVWSGA